MIESYKMTPIGRLPDEWDIAKLGDFLDYIQPTNYITNDINPEGETPVLTANKAFVLGFTCEKENIFSETPVIIFDDFTTASKFVDFSFKVRSSALKILKPNANDINILYLYESLKSINYQCTEHKRYWISEYQFLKIPIPPLAEQKKIADILSTVDAKIEVIDHQIKETLEFKRGLMQRLLSKGIGHTEFKDSPLGEIPKSWDVKLLDNCAERASGHTPNKKEKSYYNGGIKWVSLGDSKKLDNRYISNTKVEISEDGIKNSSAVLHPKGTVLLSRDAGIGKSAVMKTEMAVSQHFIVWRCNEKINNWFLYYTLQQLKPMFERVAIGSTIKTIGLGFFKKLKIIVPPIHEQQKIANILNLVDDKLDVLIDKKTHNQEFKQGLMQQLLTGKIRVNNIVEA